MPLTTAATVLSAHILMTKLTMFFSNFIKKLMMLIPIMSIIEIQRQRSISVNDENTKKKQLELIQPLSIGGMPKLISPQTKPNSKS